MKKQLIFTLVFSFIIFSVGGVSIVLAAAQPISGIDISAKKNPGTVSVAGEPIPGVDEELGKNTKGTITISDLDIDNVGTLPTSRFYFLKQWGRSVERLFAFSSVVKAQVELKIANKIAAETLVLEEKSPNDTEALKKALENYTKSQERLNEQLSKLSEKSENPNIAELLKKVDEKTAKHVALFNQITQNHNDDEQDEDKNGVRKAGKENQEYLEIFDEALSNTLKTFTIIVTPINDEPAMKQKAELQIKNATMAITEAGDALAAVSTTRGTATESDNDSIFDRWGSMIAKSKIHLDSAKKSFAEGKYGEAYGQARSALAIVSDIIEKDTEDSESKEENDDKNDDSKNEDDDKSSSDKS
ncbi:DUF5667 domain-containing protein, partial [Candidatus Nomurabacteria bacterium]|nr:DUF5667 domain-containing protein [Candidatus Nomurabacteria bacterium]